MIVDCSDNAQWARYLQQNPLLRRAEHLRPLGSHDLPVPDGRVGGRQYSLIVSGPPGAGKTALLDLMGVPAEARLPAVVPGADPATDLEGLLAYGDLVAARPYHPVVESSVRDTFGPYALRLAARGVPLTEEFKVKAIRAISATYYPVEYLTAQLVADAPTRDPRREIDSLFYRYQKAGRGAAQILIGESPAAMLSLLMYQCGWFFRLISQ